MAARSIALIALVPGLLMATATVGVALEGGSTLPTVIDWPVPVVAPSLLTTAVLPFDGGLVAVGQEQDGVTTRAAAWWSADEDTWERTIIDGPKRGYAAMRDVVAIPAGLVAMGPYGLEQCSGSGEAGVMCTPSEVAVWHSSDGRTWERGHSRGAMGRGSVVALAGGPQGVLAVGMDRDGSARTWRSPDGAAWEATTLSGPGFDRATLNDVASTPDGWVMVGSTGGRDVPASAIMTPNDSAGAAWTSADGISWQPAAVDGTGEQVELRSVFVGADGLTAVGSLTGGKQTTMWTSVDGTAWTLRDPGPDGASTPVPSASDGGTIFATTYRFEDEGGTGWWASADGIDWAELESSGVVASVPRWDGGVSPDSVALVDGTLIVLGRSGEDELVWLARPGPVTVPSPSVGPGSSTTMDALATWGPLAVVDDPAIGGLDAGLGPGRLVIGERCVFIQGRNRRSRTTLVWRSGQTRWDAARRQIVYQDRDLGEIRLSDGDRMTLGGYGIGTADRPDNTGVPIGPWINEPDASCPAERFVAQQVVPQDR